MRYGTGQSGVEGGKGKLGRNSAGLRTDDERALSLLDAAHVGNEGVVVGGGWGSTPTMMMLW